MRRTLLALAVLLPLVAACGSASTPSGRVSPGASPSASASISPSPSASPIPSPSPTPIPTPVPVLAVGQPAWVVVSVASGWRSPSSPRPVDTLALGNPAHPRMWLAVMTAADEVGLIDRLDTQVLLGDEVLVLELLTGWARVAVVDQATPLDARGYPVWIPRAQLSAIAPPESGTTVVVRKPTAWLAASDGTQLEVSYGTRLPVIAAAATSYTVGLPGGLVMTIASGSVTAWPMPATGASIVADGRAFLGLPYLWGGTSGWGFDCSGLVHVIYKAHGLALPRNSDPQSKVGAAVARGAVQPGDLVFFSTAGSAYHVAIFAGSGAVIDSPSPGYPVEQVALNTMPLVSDYSGARRVLSAAPQPSPTGGLPKSLSGAEWTKLPTTDRVVALTFDAGGNNAGVAAILKALHDAGVPATFFLTGRWTEVYPKDAQAVAATYGIGNHTYNHPRLTDLTDAQVRDQVQHAQSAIVSTTGDDPRPLFRFPYGSVDARVLADVHALGYGGVRWTVDTLGWEGRSLGQSAATVEQRVLAALTPGEIVLMHVGAANDGTTLDAAALPAIIRDVEARGYRFVLVASYI